MTGELRAALALSVGLHTAALVGLSVAPMDRPAFDVERGLASVEIFIVAPPSAAPADTPPPVPPPDNAADPLIPAPPEPAPRTVITPEQQGAITELLPGYLRNPAPVYPPVARERGYEGTVVLEAEVLASGRCGRLRVLTSSGHAVLDDAALKAVKLWRFKPARRGRIPVGTTVEIPVTFRLVDRHATP